MRKLLFILILGSAQFILGPLLANGPKIEPRRGVRAPLRLMSMAPQSTMLLMGVSGGGGGGGTNTFTLSQHVNTGSGACNGGAGADCPALTVSATGAGNVGVIMLLNAQASGHNIASVSGGGTWVIPAASACELGNNNEGDVSCAYILSLTGGVTSITVTMNAASTLTDVTYWEYSVSPGPALLDTTGTVRNTSASTSQTCNTLTLTGTKDIIVSGIVNSAGNVSSVASPYGNLLATSFKGASDNENTAVGTGPTYTLASSGTAICSAIAIK